MCSLLDLNDDCLLEIVKRLPRNKDRLSLFVVSNRFPKLLEDLLIKMDPDYLYQFVRALNLNEDRDAIELICSFITRLSLSKIDSDTIDFFANCGKYISNLEILSITDSISLAKEEYFRFVQVFKPILGRLKKLYLVDGVKTNFIVHTRNLEYALFIGNNLFDGQTFATFLRRNKETLQFLECVGDSNIFSVQDIKSISKMRCLQDVNMCLYKRGDFVNLVNGLACGNTVRHLKLYLRWMTNCWNMNLSPETEMTSLEFLTIRGEFFYKLEHVSITNFPNLKLLCFESHVQLTKKHILHLLKSLPRLELIIINKARNTNTVYTNWAR